MSTACTLTPSALSEMPEFSTLRSSIVTSTRSMSDFAQTVSCEQAAAEDDRQDRPVLLDLLDERVERRGECLLNRISAA